MTMTVPEIQAKQFHVRFRGFDIDEVDAFLEKAAMSLQAAQDENRNLAEQLKDMAKELSGYQRQRQSFQNAIMAAQNITEQMKEKSRREAEEILVDARAKAHKLLDEAKDDVAFLVQELDRLRVLKIQAQEELRRQLTSYLQMLEPQPVPCAGAEDDLTLVAGAATAAGISFSSPDQAPQTLPMEEEPDSATTFDLTGEDDLNDLYTRVDLPDDALLESYNHGEDDLFGPGAIAPPGREYPAPAVEEEEETASVPDLDGDMIFTLDDPLDEQEPSFALTDEDGEEESRAGQKKDPFSPDDSPL
jgi:cell division initiation protein